MSLDYPVLEQLLETSVDAVQVSDEEGRFLYLNEVALNRLGIDPDQVSNHFVWDIEAIFDGRNDHKWKDHVEELKEKKSLVLEGVNRNLKTGKTFPVEVVVSYRMVEGKGLVVASSRDISVRKGLQRQLFKNTKSLVDHYHLVSRIHTAVNNIFLGKTKKEMNRSLQQIVEKYPVDRISYYFNLSAKKQFIRMIQVVSSRLKDTELPSPLPIVWHDGMEVILKRMQNESLLFFQKGFDAQNSFEGGKKDRMIKSAVIFSLKHKSQIYGFIKLDYITKERKFDRRLRHFMSIYGSILNSSLQAEVLGRELQQSNLIFNQISHNSNDVCFLYSVKDGFFEFASSMVGEMFDIKWNNHLNFAELWGKGNEKLIKHAFSQLKDNDYTECDFQVNVSGTEKFILMKLNAIRDDRGRLIKASGLCTDITYQKRATFELTKSLELISLKNQELEDKNKQIKDLLKKQEADLYIKTVKMSQNNSLLNKIGILVEGLEVVKSAKSVSELNRIKKYINNVMKDRSRTWEELRMEFEKIRPNFFKNLTKKYPGLSANDLKHCYYVVTGLNSKETADLLNVTIRTIETARYRIKKKFELGRNEKLITFLQKMA